MNAEAEELKVIFKKSVARKISLDLKGRKKAILVTFDAALDKSSLGGTRQHVEVLEWAENLLELCSNQETWEAAIDGALDMYEDDLRYRRLFVDGYVKRRDAKCI